MEHSKNPSGRRVVSIIPPMEYILIFSLMKNIYFLIARERMVMVAKEIYMFHSGMMMEAGAMH